MMPVNSFPLVLPSFRTVQEKNHRILVVDDNEAIHADFSKILGDDSAEAEFDAEEAEIFGPAVSAPRRLVFQLSFASQGVEALELVRASRKTGQRYSLVFMDVRMPPGWDGLETALKLWEADPDLQVVICTAYSDKSWEEMIEKLGNPERVLILKKPFDTIEVLQMAHALTEKWSLLQSSRHNLANLEQTVRARTKELQAAHDGLQASEERFRKLSSSAPIGIFESDAAGSVLYTNPQWQKITCMPLLESLGNGWQRGVHSDDIVGCLASWRTAVETGGDFEREFRYRRPSGEDRWVQARATPIRSPSGEVTGHVGSVEDITERKALERELARARDVAVESANLKSRFLANMSHEIRTPMNGILGMTDLVLESELTGEQRSYLDMAKTSGQALLRLINDILDFSKIEAGKLKLETVGFGLRETVEHLLKPLYLRAEKKGLELHSDIADEVSEFIVGDPLRLRQILLNFTDNALKFTEQGSILVRVALEAKGNAEQCLHFSIADTGIGIPAEKQQVIFDAFAQVDGSTTRNYGGTGLGLAIASQLVLQMRGRVWVESSVDKGTTFHFTAWFGVTQKPGSSESLADLVLPNEPAGPPVSLRILLAEDNVINRALASAILEKRGHSIVHATDGHQVLQAVDREAFDLIFMDVQMPEMDGYEATRRIREREQTSGCRRTRIAAMTAHAMTGDRERCLAAGMDDYVSKPLQKAELLAVLARSPKSRASLSSIPNGPVEKG